MNFLKTDKSVPVHVLNSKGENIGHFEEVWLHLLEKGIEYKFGKGILDRTKMSLDMKFSVNLFEGKKPIVLSSKHIEKFSYSKNVGGKLIVVLELKGWAEV